MADVQEPLDLRVLRVIEELLEGPFPRRAALPCSIRTVTVALSRMVMQLPRSCRALRTPAAP